MRAYSTARVKRSVRTVPGMYGGFAYQLGETGTTLTVNSWSRVCEGSGQRHEITPDGCRLTDEGFV